jgi:hypothetical protein
MRHLGTTIAIYGSEFLAGGQTLALYERAAGEKARTAPLAPDRLNQSNAKDSRIECGTDLK